MGLKMVVKKSSNCFEYVDESYWDINSTSAFGTYTEGVGWSSIDSTAEGNIIVLIPLGIVPWASTWPQGYQPISTRIFFTGPSTVNVYLLQREEASSDTLLLAQLAYSSGDLITLEGSYSSGTTKLSSIALEASVPGIFVMSSIIFCF